jgi:hypothetical protein
MDLPTPSKTGHEIDPTKTLEIVFSIAQADKHFKVCDVGRVSIGNVRDASAPGKAVDTAWTSLKVDKQARANADDPWMVELALTFLPKFMTKPEAVGKTFLIDLKADIQEVERLGLDEGLGITKTFYIKVAAKGGAKVAPVSEAETNKRQRVTTSCQEIYMGQFEVSDAAVNLAMMNLRDDNDGGQTTAMIMTKHEEENDALKQILIEECARQFDDLALRATPLGFDIAPSLALWQLPSELLGTVDASDAEALKKQVADLKAQLKAAKERISYLEGASSATKASRQIAELRRQMVAKKANGDAHMSKACSIQ